MIGEYNFTYFNNIEGWGEGKNGTGKSGIDYQVSYGYDPSGRIRTLSWNAGGKADSATYDYVEKSHLLSSMKTGSGFATSYSYEEHRNVKTSVSNSFGNTAVSTYTYEYDELGRRKSVKNSGSAFTNPNFNIYGYNDRSEVTASSSFTGEDLANKNNSLADRSRAYNYDPIGNRKTASEAANNLTYTANSLNQYESISGGANPETPAYDLDGNMTLAKGMVYSYNAENRLVEAAPQNPQQGSVKATYIYDYMGRRAQKNFYTYSSGSWQKQKDQSFVYDGWNMVKESEKTSDSSPEVPVYYVWGLDLSQSMQGAGGVGGLIASVKSGKEYLYSYDANGNVGQMVKSTDGSISARYEYDPFGKTIFSEGPMSAENPYRFSTKYQDAETGLYYYGFRFYDVEPGRWINRDPMEEQGGLNMYAFNINDPISYIDMLGLEACKGCNGQKSIMDTRGRELASLENNYKRHYEASPVKALKNAQAHYMNVMSNKDRYTDQQIKIARRRLDLEISQSRTYLDIIKRESETLDSLRKDYLASIQNYTACYNNAKCGQEFDCKEWYCATGSTLISTVGDGIGMGAGVGSLGALMLYGTTPVGMGTAGTLFAISTANNVATALICQKYNDSIAAQALATIGVGVSFKQSSILLGPQVSGFIGLAATAADVIYTLELYKP